MAVLAVAAAGAWAGSTAFGAGAVLWGMSGAQLGWMAGSMLGNALFAPTQKGEGPRLGDLQVSGSAYGTPIPYVAGHPRIAGQIVWASKKREIATTQSAGGKGGGGSEYTTYTYEVDLLILLSDNIIQGVARIWSNGELVYSDGVPKDNLWARMTQYGGTESQLPDPDYEAAVGSENAPAYRGRGSVFIKSLQLGGGGQMPNLTFEIGESAAPKTDYLHAPLTENGLDVVSPAATYSAGPNGHSFGPDGCRVVVNSSGNIFSYNASASNKLDISDVTSRGLWELKADIKWSLISESGTGGNSIRFFMFGSGITEYGFGYRLINGVVQIMCYAYSGRSISFQTSYGAIDGEYKLIFDMRGASNEWYVQWVVNDVIYRTLVIPYFPTNNMVYFGPYNGVSGGVNAITFKSIKTSQYINAGIQAVYDRTLKSVVESICSRSDLSESKVDTTALSAITRPVRTMAISTVSSARTVLEMLAAAYHFDCVLSDKLYFRPRASAPVATLTFDEFGVAVDSSSNADPLPLMMANELEIPAQLAITFSNVGGDYQTDTQYSDRLLTGQESTSATSFPLGFTASEGKQIADALLLDKAVSALSTTVGVGITRARLEPTDVVLLTGDDGSSYRMRITKRTEAAGVITLGCVADDATVFTQAGVTAGGTASQTTVLATPITTFALLDVPLLRDADDLPGFYIAVMGSAANWSNCAIYSSLDDLTYTLVTTLADQTAIGTCSTPLGNWSGGNVFDEASTVTVNVGAIQQLSSVTRDDILTNTATNAALIGNELVQYRTATLISGGVYTLSGFLRGRRGTEWAQAGHASGERFVLLGNSGLRYIALQSGDLGRARYYKAASAGQKLSDVTAQAITPAGVPLETLSPVNARANRATADTVLTWTRRTRLSTRLVGTLPINSPLGETTEAYEVEVWDSTYTTLKRTLATSTPSATYTSAQQVADFGGAQAILRLKIFQLSSTVARGYPLTVSI